MNSIQKETIKFYAKQLRVPTFNNYEKIIRQLSVDDSYEQFLIELMKQELAERSVTGQKRRIKAAKFPSLKTLDEFDMTMLENVSESTVRQLASCDFIKQRQNIVAADVNQDTQITVAEAVLIQNYLIGRIREFPVEAPEKSVG